MSEGTKTDTRRPMYQASPPDESAQRTWAALLTLDQRCRIARANPAAATIAGVDSATLVGKRFCDAYLAVACPDPGGLTCQFARALRGTERRTAPRWASLAPGGEPQGVLLGATSGRSGAERLGAHQVLVTMVTSEFVDSADRRRREMIAGAVHDMRHAVAVQTLATDLLSYSPLADSPEVAAIIDKLQHATASLSIGIEDLLNRMLFDLDGIAVQPREMLLEPLVRQIVWQLEPLLQRRGQRVRVDVPRGLQLYADPNAVSHMLVNLLTNAHKYAGADDQFVVSARYTSHGEAVRIAVRDHGPGVPAAERRRIFARFFRGGAADGQIGAGLGLAIVHSLASRHGGHVGVRAPAGGGALFWIELPRRATEAARESLSAPGLPPA